MIPKECKRIAEVDFPIAAVSVHSTRESQIRRGHPKSLHLWWARRPLAACRAILLALLLPDPCDENCPEDFKTKARSQLGNVQGKTGPKDLDLRSGLLKFIGESANWDLASNPLYIEVARGLVKAAHGEEPPLVVDPFAGGGSIPFEALRLGCDAFASDLNPVACVILKVMLEDIPRGGAKLTEEIRRVGDEIKNEAEKDLRRFYPPHPDGATPVAYIWARTVLCESSNCGAELPLVRSLWLRKKACKSIAFRFRIARSKDRPPQILFDVFAPSTEEEVSAGTINNGKATCPACTKSMANDRVQAQLSNKRGGADDARLIAVIVARNGGDGREYRVPTKADLNAAVAARAALSELLSTSTELGGDLEELLNPIRPSPNARGVSAPTRYGTLAFKDLFTSRQRLALMTLSRAVQRAEVFDRSKAPFTRGGQSRAAVQCALPLEVVR